MKKLLCLSVCIPLLVNAQQDRGIQFRQDLTWKQVLTKAKEDNKYIFVDCYATWCGPCKSMDREVYPKQTVGDYFKDRFIAFKMQMDTSKQDDDLIRAAYTDAAATRIQYRVTAFPSYLFFSPDGRIIHRYLGAMSDTLFLRVAANALDPYKQYYTLLAHYKQGERDSAKMFYLINISKKIGDIDLSNAIAKEYIKNYLNNLSTIELGEKKNIEFITSSAQLLSSTDKVFDLFYHHGESIDRLMDQKGISEGVVEHVITKEEINLRLWPDNKPIANTPDWNKLTDSIAMKFGQHYAEKTVLDAQLRWYNEKKDWPELVKYYILKVEKFGLDTTGIGKYLLNNMIWEVIFMHSNDKIALGKGLRWMEQIMRTEPNDGPNMDTYANLLYKVGRTQEAFHWEEKALQIATHKKKKAEIDNDTSLAIFYKDQIKDFERTLTKMKNGIPTWPVNSNR